MLFRSNVSELSPFTSRATKSIGARPKRSQIALKSEDMGCVAISSRANTKPLFREPTRRCRIATETGGPIQGEFR